MPARCGHPHAMVLHRSAPERRAGFVERPRASQARGPIGKFVSRLPERQPGQRQRVVILVDRDVDPGDLGQYPSWEVAMHDHPIAFPDRFEGCSQGYHAGLIGTGEFHCRFQINYAATEDSAGGNAVSLQLHDEVRSLKFRVNDRCLKKAGEQAEGPFYDRCDGDFKRCDTPTKHCSEPVAFVDGGVIRSRQLSDYSLL